MKFIKYKTYMYTSVEVLSFTEWTIVSKWLGDASTWNSKFARQQQVVFYDLAYKQGQLL